MKLKPIRVVTFDLVPDPNGGPPAGCNRVDMGGYFSAKAALRAAGRERARGKEHVAVEWETGPARGYSFTINGPLP